MPSPQSLRDRMGLVNIRPAELVTFQPPLTAYTLSDSDVHESQEFRSVRARLLSNVQPVRSLAGAAYCSETILAAAREHGAIPLHAFKMNARNFEESETLYQKLVNFVRY